MNRHAQIVLAVLAALCCINLSLCVDFMLAYSEIPVCNKGKCTAKLSGLFYNEASRSSPIKLYSPRNRTDPSYIISLDREIWRPVIRDYYLAKEPVLKGQLTYVCKYPAHILGNPFDLTVDTLCPSPIGGYPYYVATGLGTHTECTSGSAWLKGCSNVLSTSSFYVVNVDKFQASFGFRFTDTAVNGSSQFQRIGDSYVYGNNNVTVSLFYTETIGRLPDKTCIVAVERLKKSFLLYGDACNTISTFDTMKLGWLRPFMPAGVLDQVNTTLRNNNPISGMDVNLDHFNTHFQFTDIEKQIKTSTVPGNYTIGSSLMKAHAYGYHSINGSQKLMMYAYENNGPRSVDDHEENVAYVQMRNYRFSDKYFRLSMPDDATYPASGCYQRDGSDGFRATQCPDWGSTPCDVRGGANPDIWSVLGWDVYNCTSTFTNCTLLCIYPDPFWFNNNVGKVIYSNPEFDGNHTFMVTKSGFMPFSGDIGTYTLEYDTSVKTLMKFEGVELFDEVPAACGFDAHVSLSSNNSYSIVVDSDCDQTCTFNSDVALVSVFDLKKGRNFFNVSTVSYAPSRTRSTFCCGQSTAGCKEQVLDPPSPPRAIDVRGYIEYTVTKYADFLKWTWEVILGVNLSSWASVFYNIAWWTMIVILSIICLVILGVLVYLGLLVLPYIMPLLSVLFRPCLGLISGFSMPKWGFSKFVSSVTDGSGLPYKELIKQKKYKDLNDEMMKQSTFILMSDEDRATVLVKKLK